jgi:hypothetical protein
LMNGLNVKLLHISHPGWNFHGFLSPAMKILKTTLN